MRSVSLIFTFLFIAFVIHAIWNIASIFRAPNCEKGDICYSSFLYSKPELDLMVYISDNSKSGDYDLILYENRFDYYKAYEKEINLKLSKAVRNNGSLMIHTVLVPSKYRPKNLDLRELGRIPDVTYSKSHLTKYAVPVSASFNLLEDETYKTPKPVQAKPVTHLKSKFAMVLCTENFNLSRTSAPMEMYPLLKMNSKKEFLPILQKDIMNMRIKDLVEITPKTYYAKLLYMFTPISVGKLRFLLHIQLSLQQFLALGFTEKDIDEVKNVFADTNLILLSVTVAIASVHLLLDFLSFKNDVSFWKNQKSMAGLSKRTVLWRSFSQTVIFLYLLDEGTSLLILIPTGVATIIEFWKVSKVYKTTVAWKRGVVLSSNSKESAEEMKTREYDDECMKYLGYVLYPLCIGAAAYSLIYQPHKSWYSWTMNSLVNGVYAFGFLFMLPQLFINYRLKSVAALPWRAFTYRAFNTFIDDIFAFIITMPTAHRLACFRDDVVFIIYLYQRWLYPVDKTRSDDLSPGGDENEMLEIEGKKKK